MTNPANKVIYGVCDKTNKSNFYFGFFSDELKAKKEMKSQANKMKEDLGMLDLIIKEDRVIIPKKNRVEEILILIEKYELK